MYKWILLIIGLIIVFYIIINIIPPQKSVKHNPFIIKKGEKPLIAAHRGGKDNPENTLKAIKYSVEELKIDALEIDLCITKDDYLILNHDYTVNSTTDAELFFGEKKDYYVNDLTLKELQKLNFGFNYTNEDGKLYNKLLKGVSDFDREDVLIKNDLQVVTIENIFELYKNKNIFYIIELKNTTDLGKKSADILIKIIKEYGLENKVIIGQFHEEVSEYISKKYPDIYHGGSQNEIKRFVLKSYFGLNLFNKTDFSGYQVPMVGNVGKFILRLDKRFIIKNCHKKNISVQYWTINNEQDMIKLIDLGTDIIMTDNPELLKKVIENKFKQSA